MSNKTKSLAVGVCILLVGQLFLSCKWQKSKVENEKKQFEISEIERNAIDTLKSHDLVNYLDSAYLYTYVYFGSDILKQCGNANIDSVLPDVPSRRIVCQNLIVRRVRILPDSSFVFLALTPLVKDSILSCDMVEGPQLPHEVLFNYKTKRFVQFVYDETGFLRINANPILDYENGLKKIIDSEKLNPHQKFTSLMSRMR
jgi:hypothetical protein